MGTKKGAAVLFSEFKKRKKESDDREKREQGQAKIKLQYVCLILAHENKMETEKRRRKQQQYHKNKEWELFMVWFCIQGVGYVTYTWQAGDRLVLPCHAYRAIDCLLEGCLQTVRLCCLFSLVSPRSGGDGRLRQVSPVSFDPDTSPVRKQGPSLWQTGVGNRTGWLRGSGT